MARVALVVLVLALVAAALAQTNSPPNVQGQWSDQACNLIPGSDQLYQNRTFFFSAVNTKTLDGTYELHQQLYNDASCTPSLEIMRVIEKGSFKLGDRANLERFWDIDYTVTSRSMQVFTSNFADTVNSYVSCKFPTPFVPNLQQDITSISCSEFNILSAGECPMIYDIVRRDGTTLYIGQRYPGNPPQFVPPCITVCRPADYDHFSLAKQATATPTPAQPTLAPNPNPGTGVIFNAGDALGPLELIELSSSELSANAASSLVASVVLVALVALAIAM